MQIEEHSILRGCTQSLKSQGQEMYRKAEGLFELKETKETRQINAFRILEWVLEKEDKKKDYGIFYKGVIGTAGEL